MENAKEQQPGAEQKPGPGTEILNSPFIRAEINVPATPAAPTMFDQALVQVVRDLDGKPAAFKVLAIQTSKPMSQQDADFLNGHYTGFSHFEGLQYYPKGKYKKGDSIEIIHRMVSEADIFNNPELEAAGVGVGDIISFPADATVEGGQAHE